ncbi:MAG: hypothetical protein JNK64_28740 [Myxococcales bacterium]|nr:hypothetical protein [Myxococcales bacterium]
MVLERPQDSRVAIPVFHTQTQCAGSAAAYLLRRIAYRAGAYAPGIQEYVFFELSNHAVAGGSIDAVQRWFGAKVGDLQEMGYRLNARRVAEPTPTILEWVKEGRGFRGALIPTNFRKLHPAESEDVMHAVAVAVDRLEPGADEQLVMVDPWPGVANGARDKTTVPPVLESAHRDYKFNAIIFYWAGWS